MKKLGDGYNIDLVRGVDKNTGSPVYAYVIIPEEKRDIYCKKVAAIGGGFEQEGAVVLFQGIGETVPEEITSKIEKLIEFSKSYS